ncbi:sensor histidine kinase [Nocardia sp. NPDC051570]|uniref:sensor histidine kinase n=1 Tax=Nocardia sp. NPDC051570 TaxID=3364324 RepID=UPI0037A64C8B
MKLADLPQRFSRLLDRAVSEPGRPSGWRQGGFGVFLAVVWLLYLISPISQRWSDGAHLRAGIAAAAAIGLMVLIALTFAVFRRGNDEDDVLADASPVDPRVWAALAAMSLLSLALVTLLGGAAIATVMYVAATAVIVLPSRESGFIVIAVVAALCLLVLVLPDWGLGAWALFFCLIPMGIWFAREIGTRSRRLRELARRQRSELTIVEDRNRVARDVHDILGHSLTVITIKTELAGRLVDLDPARAKAELAEVEALAREALAGVRDTVGGLREMSLTGELATARTALHAAGIRADLPVTVDLPAHHSILFGWVLREAITNIVRHSDAQHCTVRVDPTTIEITDDGIGLANASFGSGLTGLRERVRAAGGTLELGEPAGGGLCLRATLP